MLKIHAPRSKLIKIKYYFGENKYNLKRVDIPGTPRCNVMLGNTQYLLFNPSTIGP